MIPEFWPTDDANTIYTLETDLETIIQLAKQKWPDTQLNQINIGAAHIHTNCLGYDLYDPGDYTEFVIITRLLNGSY